MRSHDGQETTEIPDILVARIPDDRASDDGDGGVDADERSTLFQLVRGDGDAKGVDGGGRVGRCGEAERGDRRVSLAREDLRGGRRKVVSRVIRRNDGQDGELTTGKK